MTTVQEMFKEGIELRNSGKLNEAIDKFHSIIDAFPSNPKKSGEYAVLAGVYGDKGDYENSRTYFSRALEINPNSELASLGLYVSLVELGKNEEAIFELKRYLESCKSIQDDITGTIGQFKRWVYDCSSTVNSLPG